MSNLTSSPNGVGALTDASPFIFKFIFSHCMSFSDFLYLCFFIILYLNFHFISNIERVRALTHIQLMNETLYCADGVVYRLLLANIIIKYRHKQCNSFFFHQRCNIKCLTVHSIFGVLWWKLARFSFFSLSLCRISACVTLFCYNINNSLLNANK